MESSQHRLQRKTECATTTTAAIMTDIAIAAIIMANETGTVTGVTTTIVRTGIIIGTTRT